MQNTFIIHPVLLRTRREEFDILKRNYYPKKSYYSILGCHDTKTVIGSNFERRNGWENSSSIYCTTRFGQLYLCNMKTCVWFLYYNLLLFSNVYLCCFVLYFCSEPVQSRHGTIVVALKDEWVRHSLAQVTTCFSFHCIIFAYFVFVFLSELVLRVPHSFDQTTTCFFFNSIKPGTTFSLSILKKA